MKRRHQNPRRRLSAAAEKASLLLAKAVQPPSPPKLRYVSDATAGISRRRNGKGFTYVGPDGRTVRDPAVIRRIRSAAVPPAWTKVWICPRDDGHIQAVGRDAKGRKQYRYHPAWRDTRERDKYHRMIAFGRSLPRIRRQVKRDLARTGLPREKILATVVDLLQLTHIRVGNEEYARENRSYGLTTLRDRHVHVRGDRLRFRFQAKSGKSHRVELSDPRLARVVRRCQELPGQELFQYVDEQGEVRSIDSGDVNDYLRRVAGDDFTAKDFRTWAGTVLAACALRELEPCRAKTRAKRDVLRAIDVVAERLGNTRAVCRKSYIHPRVIDSYIEGICIPRYERRLSVANGRKSASLTPDEKAVLELLRRAPAAEAPRLAS